MNGPVLSVSDLSVAFGVPAVRGVSFEIGAGEVVALVGESGSGKSTVALALMGLLDGSGAETRGRALLARKAGGTVDLLAAPERAMRALRGEEIAMIFQEPMASLDPLIRVGDQIGEALAAHRGMDRAARRAEAIGLLGTLGVPAPERAIERYPHELSGGMRQRAMIAMAISCRPRLLIADEPTTALDATIQAQIVDHLRDLRRHAGMAMLFITHDLGLVAEIADRVLVMYAGQIVESGPVSEVFRKPGMPYTAGLMRSRPKLGARRKGEARIEPIPGGAPDPSALPPGCAFHPRCAFARPDPCARETPDLVAREAGRRSRCWRWGEIAP